MVEVLIQAFKFSVYNLYSEIFCLKCMLTGMFPSFQVNCDHASPAVIAK